MSSLNQAVTSRLFVHRSEPSNDRIVEQGGDGGVGESLAARVWLQNSGRAVKPDLNSGFKTNERKRGFSSNAEHPCPEPRDSSWHLPYGSDAGVFTESDALGHQTEQPCRMLGCSCGVTETGDLSESCANEEIWLVNVFQQQGWPLCAATLWRVFGTRKNAEAKTGASGREGRGLGVW